jgi:large subunit ribosomal protein L17
MKHLKTGRKFGRKKKQREALLKIMLGDLLMKGKITTTLAKAKELKMNGEKMIGRFKNSSSLRQIKAELPRHIDSKTIQKVAKKTASRNSGYLKITKKGPRLSDGSPMAIIEIIEDVDIEKTVQVKSNSKKKA